MSPEQLEEYGPEDEDEEYAYASHGPDHGYDYPDAVDIAEEWKPGQCDRCAGPPATDAEKRAQLASALIPVCACWAGQGAPAELCECGPELFEKEEKTMTEEEAATLAREVWPEAEGFERAPAGWTFRVGAGYASVTDSGRVATDPQGTRSYAKRFMHHVGSETTEA